LEFLDIGGIYIVRLWKIVVMVRCGGCFELILFRTCIFQSKVIWCVSIDFLMIFGVLDGDSTHIF